MRKRLLGAALGGGMFLLLWAVPSPIQEDITVHAKEQNGWVRENGRYYFYRSGKKAKGLLRRNGKVYYLNPLTGARMSGVVKVGKRYYYFDPKTGARKRGLVRSSGKIYYFSKKWYAAKGFHRVGKKLLYCNDRGLVCRPSGIVSYNNKRYYYDPNTGRQKAGWIHIGENTYYFSWSKRYALTGWQTIRGQEYYFNSRGLLLYNRWIGEEYYVDDNGRKVKGWLKLGNEQYYMDEITGKMTIGFVTVDGETYYFDKEGLMVQNAWVDGCWLDENGVMARDTWVDAYYVGENGKRTGTKRSPGLFSDGEDTYYLDSSYQPITGWVLTGGTYYYFDELSGVLRKNLWVGDYYVGEDGKRVTGKLLTVNEETYYFDEAGLPVTGLFFLNDTGYFFDKKGVAQTGFVEMGGGKYYFDPSSKKMTVNQEIPIKGVRYLFDGNGRLIKETKVAANAKVGQAIADYAVSFEGNPYKSGGTSLTEGADSSGFTQAVMAHFGISIPRISRNQATGEASYGSGGAKPKQVQIKELQPGDLVFYGDPINHVAVYLGNRQIIHAFNTDLGIIQSRYDYRTITGCARYW